MIDEDTLDWIITYKAIDRLQSLLLEINKLPGLSVEAKTIYDGATRYAAVGIHGCEIKDGRIIVTGETK